MELSKKELEHLSLLSRLALEGVEENKLNKDISKILDYIGSLAKADVENVEPTAQVTGLNNRGREDKVQDKALLASPDEVVSCAPQVEKNLVKVRAVLD